MELCDAGQIKALLERHGFRFSKALGQNFLVDGGVVQEIAAASGAGPDCGVLEVGPGIGVLTVQLAQRARRVAAVELDRALLPILAETPAPYPNAAVLPGDVMKLDLDALADQQFQGLTPLVCANLPYNITTPAVTKLLSCRRFARVTVMIQREAAQRVCARPGDDGYGLFSVLCRYYAQPEVLFTVPPACFLPPPKVTSAVVRLTPRPQPDYVHDEALFFRVVRAAFAQRRKTLLNALAAAFPVPKPDLAHCLTAAGLPLDVRGERLDLPAFAALSDSLAPLL